MKLKPDGVDGEQRPARRRSIRRFTKQQQAIRENRRPSPYAAFEASRLVW